MYDNEYKVVKFKNISDFDFLPHMGAMYGGKPFPVLKGQSKLFPFTVGDSLAKHLAMQIMLKGTKVADDAAKSPNGTVLWTDEDIKRLKTLILEEVYTEDVPAPQSLSDVIAARVESLNKETGTSKEAIGYLDKKKVVEALTALKVPFNSRASLETLQKLLKEETEKVNAAEAGINASLPTNLVEGADETGKPAEVSVSEILAANMGGTV